MHAKVDSILACKQGWVVCSYFATCLLAIAGNCATVMFCLLLLLALLLAELIACLLLVDYLLFAGPHSDYSHPL
jgi:hypothetical protein